LSDVAVSERRGSQTPRSLLAPAGVDLAYAGDVVGIAGDAGLWLDPWQDLVIKTGCGTRGQLFAASEVGCWVPRQNGKGSVIEALVLAFVLLADRPVKVIWSAHEYKTAAEGFKRFQDLIAVPWIAKRVKAVRLANGEQQVLFTDGSVVQWNTRSRKALRGFTCDLLILDEAQELTGDQMDAVMPTISARANAQIWYFGTPPSSPAAWVYTLRSRGEQGDDDLAWLDWGLDLTPDTNGDYDPAALADEDNWHAANPALGSVRPNGTGLTLRAVRREHKGLGQGFARERLGVWLPAATDRGRALSLSLWEAQARQAPLKPGKPLALAFDAWGNRWVIARAWLLEDGTTAVEIADDGPDIRIGARRLLEMRMRHSDAVVVHIDSFGPSAQVIPDIVEWRKVRPVRSGELLDAWARFVGDVHGGRIIHPGDALLDAAVAGAAVRKVGDRIALDRSRSSSSIPALVAAVLAVWGVATHKPVKPIFPS
jgi:hypothetical protein